MIARILAVLLGTFLACAMVAATVFLFFPEQANSFEWLLRFGLHPPVVNCDSIRFSERPCPPVSQGMIVTGDDRPQPRDEPLVFREVGGTRKSVFGEFSGAWAERRSLYFVLRDHGVEVDARYWSDGGGSYAGIVRSDDSGAHDHPDELCFDLSRADERLGDDRALAGQVEPEVRRGELRGPGSPSLGRLPFRT